MTVRVLSGVIAVSAFLTACGEAATSPPPIPTENDALTFVHELVDLARAGDLVGLCRQGGGNCEQALAVAGAGSVPTTDPEVLDSRVVQSSARADGTISTGGRVLTLCGVDGHGRPYVTEMLVFYDDQGDLRAIEPVYWSGLAIGTGSHTEREPMEGCPAASG